MDISNDLNFIGGFAGSLGDRLTGLDPDTSGTDILLVSGYTPQLELEAAISIATNGKILTSNGLHVSSGKALP